MREHGKILQLHWSVHGAARQHPESLFSGFSGRDGSGELYGAFWTTCAGIDRYFFQNVKKRGKSVKHLESLVGVMSLGLWAASFDSQEKNGVREEQGCEVWGSTCEAVTAVTAGLVRQDGLPQERKLPVFTSPFCYCPQRGFLTLLAGDSSLECIRNPESFRGSNQINVHCQTLLEPHVAQLEMRWEQIFL